MAVFYNMSPWQPSLTHSMLLVRTAPHGALPTLPHALSSFRPLASLPIHSLAPALSWGFAFENLNINALGIQLRRLEENRNMRELIKIKC